MPKSREKSIMNSSLAVTQFQNYKNRANLIFLSFVVSITTVLNIYCRPSTILSLEATAVTDRSGTSLLTFMFYSTKTK